MHFTYSRNLTLSMCFSVALSSIAMGETTEIDKTGWEKILVAPATGQPIPAFEGFYTGYGVMAVYGQDARILALYAEDADHTNTDLERRGSKLIASGARDQYTGMRKGPAIAASLLGKGRVIALALPPWFDTLATLGKTDNKRSAKSAKIPTDKAGKPLYEAISGTDAVFLQNALRWLAAGREPADLRIATSEKTLESGFGIGNVTLLSENDFRAQLKEADVFVGRVDSLNEAQIDALVAFAESGGGILTGGCPDKDADADKRGWYAYPIDDQVGLRKSTQKINRLLTKAGLGIAYGIIDGKGSRQQFDTNIPVQWAREYDQMFDAIDDLHAVRKDRDNSDVQFRASPEYAPADGVDSAVAVATLIGQQIFTMTQVLSDGDARRKQLDRKLKFLLQPDADRRAIEGPIRKGLSMHEAVSLGRLAPEQMRKSRIADQFLGHPVSDDHPRTDKERFELTYGRDTVQMTEFYAPPGEVVTLDFSEHPRLKYMGFHVHINVENSYNFHSELNFLRPPVMQKAFPIDQSIVNVAHPYGGIIYIRYGAGTSDGVQDSGNSGQGSIPFAAGGSRNPLLETLGDSGLTATVTGAVRYPCFVSGKHDNADWKHQLATFPGYKAGVICRNVWVDMPRHHIDQFGLEDVETWALQFDASYGRAAEVGPSVKARSTRLTDICIPGREPGMPTRMGRMSSLDKSRASYASVEQESGMTAHKVGHGLFGGKYAWARAIGTGTEFRANQMVWYENYKKGSAKGGRSVMSSIGTGEQAAPYSSHDPYQLIQAIGTYLSNSKNSYFSSKVDDAKLHADPRGKGTPHLPFLRAKWMYDFGGQQGVNVWGRMNKEFADDIRAERDSDPKTQPRFPVRSGDAHVHAEDHAVRWAHLCGYNIVPYFEVFGFRISDEVKQLNVIRESQPWLPMASRFFNRAMEIGRNKSATFDFNRTDDQGMTIALGADRRTVLPEFLGITSRPQFGTFTSSSNGVYEYVPERDFVGRDSFAYKVKHPDTGQEQVFTVFIQVISVARAIAPEESLAQFGHGGLVEVFTRAATQSGGKRKRRGKQPDGILNELSSISDILLPSSSLVTLQGFETNAAVGGYARIRAYLQVPEDGDYVFWTTSPADCVLRMNTAGSDPAEATVLLETGTSEANRTQPITLRHGVHYYVELSRGMNDSGGLSLGWSRSVDTEGPDEVIPNRYLIPVGRPMSYEPVDDQAKTTPEKSLIIEVLENDIDYRFRDIHDTQCLQVSFVGQVANGRTEIIGDRKIRYTPDHDFKGTDKFQYAIQSTSFRDRIRVGSVTVTVADE